MNSFYWYVVGGVGYVTALVGAGIREQAMERAERQVIVAEGVSQTVQTGSWLMWGGLIAGTLAIVTGFLWNRYTTDGMTPSDGAVDWLFDAYGWLLEEFGEEDELEATYLVTPTPYDIPLDAVGKDRVWEVFDSVRSHAGMDDPEEWPCRLRFHETYFSGEDTARRVGVQHEDPAARGTYQVDYEDDEAIISCDTSLASRPNELVAVLVAGQVVEVEFGRAGLVDVRAVSLPARYRPRATAGRPGVSGAGDRPGEHLSGVRDLRGQRRHLVRAPRRRQQKLAAFRLPLRARVRLRAGHLYGPPRHRDRQGRQISGYQPPGVLREGPARHRAQPGRGTRTPPGGRQERAARMICISTVAARGGGRLRAIPLRARFLDDG
ncbi:MAG: hypothetical protein ABEK29_04470, partial [Bradymonadaceae bacterium]